MRQQGEAAHQGCNFTIPSASGWATPLGHASDCSQFRRVSVAPITLHDVAGSCLQEGDQILRNLMSEISLFPHNRQRQTQILALFWSNSHL